MAEQTTPLLSLGAPVNGQNQIIDFTPGSAVNFGFTPLGFERSGADLLIEGDGNGTITLKNFFTGESTLPKFILPELGEVLAEDLLKESNIDTAMGPQPLNPAASGGFSTYTSSFGSSVDGIDTLGTLSGQQWGSSYRDIQLTNLANQLAPSSVGLFAMPLDVSDVSDVFTGYHARAFIYTGRATNGWVDVDVLNYDGFQGNLRGNNAGTVATRIFPSAAGDPGDVDIACEPTADGKLRFLVTNFSALPSGGAVYFEITSPGSEPYTIQVILHDYLPAVDFASDLQDVVDSGTLLAAGGLIFGEWYGGNTPGGNSSYSAANLNWTAGGLDDVFHFQSGNDAQSNALAYSTIAMGDGNDRFTILADNYAMMNSLLEGGLGDDNVFFDNVPNGGRNLNTEYALWGSTINLDGGNDSFSMKNINIAIYDNSTITTGDGDDSLSFSTVNKLMQKNATIDAGGGDDFCSIDKTKLLFDNATANTHRIFDLGDGDDSIAFSGTTFASGNGVDATSSLLGGNGNDFISLSITAAFASANNTLIDGGAGNDHIVLSSSGKTHNLQYITVNGGAGENDLLQVGGTLVWNANKAGVFTTQNGLTAANQHIEGFEALRIDLDDGAPQSINIDAILSNIKILLANNSIKDVYIMRDTGAVNDTITINGLTLDVSFANKDFKEIEVDGNGNPNTVIHNYFFDSYHSDNPDFANLTIHLQTMA